MYVRQRPASEKQACAIIKLQNIDLVMLHIFLITPSHNESCLRIIVLKSIYTHAFLAEKQKIKLLVFVYTLEIWNSIYDTYKGSSY